MSVRDHIRRWLREDRDTPLTLTREQAVELGIDGPASALPPPGHDVVIANVRRDQVTGEVTLTVGPDGVFCPDGHPCQRDAEGHPCDRCCDGTYLCERLNLEQSHPCCELDEGS